MTTWFFLTDFVMWYSQPRDTWNEAWSRPYTVTVVSEAHLRYRAYLCKVFVYIILTYGALHYLLSSVLNPRYIETMFTSNDTGYTAFTYESNTQDLIKNDLVTVASVSVDIANASAATSSATDIMVQRSTVNSQKTETTTLRGEMNLSEMVEVANPNATEFTALPRCPLIPPNLRGRIAVYTKIPDMVEFETKFAPNLESGGRGFPTKCEARYRVAIIVPYRARPQHTIILLYNLHPILLRQQLDYTVFIVEQEGTMQFNKAMLMNVGYVEALKERSFDCFIFHDVDLLPEDDRNLYTCPEQPRHMSVAIDEFQYKLPYEDLFGGVSAMSREQFRLVNGFSNVFWGWGGEDDDMANRIKAHGLNITRYSENIARYKMLHHKKEEPNPKRNDLLDSGEKRFAVDGLSNLQYELVDKQKLPLYTWLLVKLAPPQPS